NADPWKIDRKSGVKYIPNTGASIIGGIQPGFMSKIFSKDTIENGLLSRFLILNAGNKSQRFSRQGLNEHTHRKWKELLTWCYKLPLEYDLNGFVRPKILVLRQEALDAWEHF